MPFSGTSSRLRPTLSIALVATLLLVACASPTTRLRDLADSRGFERRAVVAGGFELTVFENAAFVAEADRSAIGPEPDAPAAAHAAVPGVAGRVEAGAADTGPSGLRVLHVYLEGDGRPWMYRVIVTPDPTPRRPLMLGLMALDPSPAVYVGRPCYNGTASDPGCTDALWTSARYSEAVVASMAGAVSAIATRRGYDAVRLFGHSGGGTLALLLAARLPTTLDVVTIAGNLDPDAWTRHHGYTPLRDSLNPVREPALDAAIRQWHLVGEADRVVPPQLVQSFIRSSERTTGVTFPGFSHGCCWHLVWPDVLRAVTRGDATMLPGRVFRHAAAAR